MGPFNRLLKSSKFWLAIFAFAKTTALYYLDIPVELIISFDAVIGTVIAGMAYEDGKEKMAVGTAIAGSATQKQAIDTLQPYRNDAKPI